MGIYGADWSDYQAAKPSTAGLAFGFTKVTEGLGYVNPNWPSQYHTATAAGLVPGKYHYPHMANSPSAEADYFLAHADVQPGDLLVLDWEGNGPGEANAGLPNSQLAAFKNDWLANVKGRCPKNPVGLYCNKSFWLDIDTTSYCQDFLWIATAGLAAGEPGVQYPWLFHQYGTSAGADADYCHLPSAAALRAWVATFQGVSVTQTLTPEDMTALQALLESTPIQNSQAFADLFWLRRALDPTMVMSPPAAESPVGQQVTGIREILAKRDASLADQIAGLSTALASLQAAVEAGGTLTEAQATAAAQAGATAALGILGKDLTA